VRLTTAKYYTPSHKVIHEHGITPDIIVPLSEDDERKLLEQRMRGSLPTEEGVDKPEKIADVQLERAVDVIKGVKLFAKQTKATRTNKPATTNR
jgi:carboxyl-terminal processing protease